MNFNPTFTFGKGKTAVQIDSVQVCHNAGLIAARKHIEPEARNEVYMKAYYKTLEKI